MQTSFITVAPDTSIAHSCATVAGNRITGSVRVALLIEPGTVVVCVNTDPDKLNT
jgi:hypothetical protein